MSENTNNTQKLYNALTKEGYADLGDYAQFEGKLKDSGKREKLYSVLQNDGFKDIGSLSEFNAKLGYPDPVEPVQGMKQPEKKGFWDSYWGDLIESIGAGATDIGNAAGSMMDKISRAYGSAKSTPVGVGATNVLRTLPIIGGAVGALDAADIAEKASPGIFKKMSDASKSAGEVLRERADRYDGKAFTDLWEEGDYTGAAGEVFLQAAESLPQSIVAMFGGGVGLAATGVMAATLKYDELDENNPEMGEVPKVINSILTGSAEALSEKLGDVPIGKWLKGIYSKIGKEAAEQTLQKGLSGWIQRQFKNYGVLLKEQKKLPRILLKMLQTV